MIKNREEWQKTFITSLISIRDYFIEQDPLEIIGKQHSVSISNILIGYFCERRIRVPIKEPSPYMTCEDIAIYINDEVLSYIYDEYPDFIDIDWRKCTFSRKILTDFFLAATRKNGKRSCFIFYLKIKINAKI
jgi:hypothetical protein